MKEPPKIVAAAVTSPQSGELKLRNGKKNKRPLARMFSDDLDGLPATDAWELPNRVCLPTSDEHVDICSRAVHGKRDFTNQKQSDARNLILNAMPAGLVAQSRNSLPLEPPRFAIRAKSDAMRPDHVARSANVGRAISQREPVLSVSSEKRARTVRFDCFSEVRELPKLEKESEPRRALYHLYSRGEASLSHPSIEASPTYITNLEEALSTLKISVVPPARKLTMRRISICAVVAVTGLVVPFLVGWFSLPWFGAATNSAVPQPAVHAALPKSVESAFSAQSGPEEFASLLKRGGELIAAGDIPRARLLLKLAAEAGDASAALELGATYDPNILKQPSVPAHNALTSVLIAPKKLGVPARDTVAGISTASLGDLALAQSWYEKSKDLGSAEAEARLEGLFKWVEKHFSTPAIGVSIR